MHMQIHTIKIKVSIFIKEKILDSYSLGHEEEEEGWWRKIEIEPEVKNKSN